MGYPVPIGYSTRGDRFVRGSTIYSALAHCDNNSNHVLHHLAGHQRACLRNILPLLSVIQVPVPLDHADASVGRYGRPILSEGYEPYREP